MIVHCATSNPGKLREFQLAAPDFDIRTLQVRVEPPEETGATFEENAGLKALYYSQYSRRLSFRRRFRPGSGRAGRSSPACIRLVSRDRTPTIETIINCCFSAWPVSQTAPPDSSASSRW